MNINQNLLLLKSNLLKIYSNKHIEIRNSNILIYKQLKEELKVNYNIYLNCFIIISNYVCELEDIPYNINEINQDSNKIIPQLFNLFNRLQNNEIILNDILDDDTNLIPPNHDNTHNKTNITSLFPPLPPDDLESTSTTILSEIDNLSSNKITEKDINQLKNHPILLFLCGFFKYYGLGCEKDVYTAFNYFKLSSDQGFVLSQCYLGNCYYSQCGIPESELNSNLDEKAFYYYSLAAQQNYSVAQYNLGLCYENGCGVDINPVESLKYYELSALQGNASAQYHLASIYESGEFCGVTILNDGTLVKNLEKSHQYYLKAANNGLALAQHTIGLWYEFGQQEINLEKNIVEAVSWYTRASNQGYSISQYILGQCYEYGKGVNKDYFMAVTLYNRAAENNHIGGQFQSGYCCQYGQGTTKDLQRAIYYYKMIEQTNSLYYQLNEEFPSNNLTNNNHNNVLNDNRTQTITYPNIQIFKLDENGTETANDSITRGITLMNLATCYEEELKGYNSLNNDNNNHKNLLLTIFKLYTLGEYLLQNDKRKEIIKKRKQLFLQTYST